MWYLSTFQSCSPFASFWCVSWFYGYTPHTSTHTILGAILNTNVLLKLYDTELRHLSSTLSSEKHKKQKTTPHYSFLFLLLSKREDGADLNLYCGDISHCTGVGNIPNPICICKKPYYSVLDVRSFRTRNPIYKYISYITPCSTPDMRYATINTIRSVYPLHHTSLEMYEYIRCIPYPHVRCLFK